MGRTVPMTKSNSDPVATVDEELMPSPEPMATDSSWNSKPNRPPNDKYVL
jgi:hypothetical protein